MSDVQVDSKRTCRAIQAPLDHPVLQPGEYEIAQPGLARKLGNDHLLFACPGCGRTGAIRAAKEKPADSPSWAIVHGSLDDVTTLTLAPSIDCVGCCKWHGHLRNGTFVSC